MMLDQSIIVARVKRNTERNNEKVLGIDSESYREMLEAKLEMNWKTYDRLHVEFVELMEKMGYKSHRKETLTAIAPSNLCQEICLPSQRSGLYPDRWDTPVTTGPIAGIIIGDVL